MLLCSFVRVLLFDLFETCICLHIMMYTHTCIYANNFVCFYAQASTKISTQNCCLHLFAVFVVFLRLTVYRIIEGGEAPDMDALEGWEAFPYRPYSNPHFFNGKASSSSGPMPPWSGSHVKTERSI